MELEGYKEVFDTRDLTDLTPMLWPNEKMVFNPHTTVKPPEGDVIIKGFDFNNQAWQYDETVNKDSYKYVSTVVASLMKENIAIKDRLEKLENPQAKEPIDPENPAEGDGEENVSE